MEIEKMEEKDIIEKLIDYVLLNAYSVSAAGLDNGKAGLALSLFEVAAFRQDERLANHAVELMKESLYTISRDISFERGLSGIAFMLLYINRYHRYVSVDFDSLFGNGRKKIKCDLSEIVKHDELCCKEMKILSYLSALGKLRDEKESFLLESLLSGVFNCFETTFKGIKLSGSEKMKNFICNLFGRLLRIVSVFRLDSERKLYDEEKFLSLSQTLCELYAENVFAGNYELGYFLRLYGERQKEKFVSETACRIMNSCLANICPETLSLRQKIDLMLLLEKNASVCRSQIDMLYRSIWQTEGMSAEQSIRSNINPGVLTCGFGEGVSRLLTYWVYRASVAASCDVARFDTLFM